MYSGLFVCLNGYGFRTDIICGFRHIADLEICCRFRQIVHNLNSSHHMVNNMAVTLAHTSLGKYLLRYVALLCGGDLLCGGFAA